MTARRGAAIGGCLAIVLITGRLEAQPISPPALEVSIAGGWSAGRLVGSPSAILTSNQVPRGGTFTLFDSRIEQEGSLGLEGRIGARLARTVLVEVLFGYSRPTVRTRITSDADSAEDVTFVGERLSRYRLEGSIVLELGGGGAAAGRWRPYVLTGGGYLRELHEGRAFVETGTLLHGGGGIKRWLRLAPDRRLRAIGLRVEGRVSVRHGGFELADAQRAVMIGSAGVIFGF